MANLVFVQFHPKPGSEPAVERILRGMIAPTRQEPGNELYDLYRLPTAAGGTVFALTERYRDQAALEAHRATAHYKDYRAKIMEHLSEPIDVKILEALDAQG
jgi:quinol monooxygenase YgiN